LKKFLIPLLITFALAFPALTIAIEDPVSDAQQIRQERIEKEQLQLEEEKKALLTKAQKLKGTYQGQCVTAVRSFLNVTPDIISGAAKTLKTDSDTPEIGAIIKLNMSKYGHVGVVLDESETTITYYDSNGSWTQRAAIRTIEKDDPRILGYKIINE